MPSVAGGFTDVSAQFALTPPKPARRVLAGAAKAKIGYGGYSSAGRAPDCGSGCRGFEPHYPPHTVAEGRSVRSGPCLTSTLGCSQVVRHGTLTPAFAGSSPAIPATASRQVLHPSFPALPNARSLRCLPLSPQSLEGGFAGTPLGFLYMTQ